MTPIQLQLHNFLSYREPAPLDFSSFNLGVLSGSNGVGKSSILEAITWAIWGQTRAGSDDELIHQGTSSCWVELIFEHENAFYRIVRKREIKGRAGQSFLEFQSKIGKSKTLLDDNHWQSISESTLKATNEKIIRVLKIPYEIFVNSSYLRQGHADEFTIKTPSERKEILSEILGLNYYEELSQKAREMRRQKEEGIKRIDFQIENLELETSKKKRIKDNLNQVQDESFILEKKITANKTGLAILEKSQKEYEIAKERLKILLERYRELQETTGNYQEEFESLRAEEKSILEKIKNKKSIVHNFQRLEELENQEVQENQKFRQYSQILQNLKVIEHIKKELDSNISRINKISNCPMCLRPMKKVESSKIILHLKKEFKEKFSHQLQKLQSDLAKLNYDELRHKKIQKEISQFSNARKDKQILDIAENNLANIKVNLEKITTNFAKIKEEAQKIALEGKTLKEKIIKLEKINIDWQEKKQEFEILNTKLLELKGRLGALKQELVQIEKQEKELIKLGKEKAICQKEIANFEELSIAFGKRGIQAMIIEQSLTIIEEGANVLLGKITDGRMSLKFVTQKEKKSAQSAKRGPAASGEDLIETLEIKIADELGQRDYEMYSGGEAFRINFAIRIALSKLLASRAGTHLKFLAIDEGFGMLDSAGRDDLVAAINSIAADFEKILVITHLQELKDLFPTKIEITKDEDGSKIEIVS